MANYLGVIPTIDNISGLNPFWNYTEYNQQLHPAGTFINDDYSKAGTLTAYLFQPLTQTFIGVRDYDYSDIFYNNYWTSPDKIELGLVTQDKNYNVYVFNSYNIIKTLNTVTNTVPQADLTIGTLPQSYNSTEEKTYPLLIHLSGNPDINGFITYNFSDFSAIIPVVGDRLIQWSLEDMSKLSIRHSLNSMTAKTKYLQQDRQRVNDNEQRFLDVEMIRDNNELGLLFGYSQDRVMGIPIPVEKSKVSDVGSLQGLSVVHTSDSISNYFELKKCNYIELYDKSKVEVIKISSIDFSTGAYTLADVINENFDGINTYIYPIVLCWVNSYSDSQKTFKQNRYSLTFKEAIINV